MAAVSGQIPTLKLVTCSQQTIFLKPVSNIRYNIYLQYFLLSEQCHASLFFLANTQELQSKYESGEIYSSNLWSEKGVKI